MCIHVVYEVVQYVLERLGQWWWSVKQSWTGM